MQRGVFQGKDAGCPVNILFVWLYLSLFVVPQHTVCSSELYHGEGGKHPAIQPLAPAHPHLTPTDRRADRTRNQTQDQHQEQTSIWTETAELKSRTLQWTRLTRLCAKFKPNREQMGIRGEARNKNAKQHPKLVLTLFDMFAFLWVISHLKLFFCCTKRDDQLPSLKRWKGKKNTIKDFLCIAAKMQCFYWLSHILWNQLTLIPAPPDTTGWVLFLCRIHHIFGAFILKLKAHSTVEKLFLQLLKLHVSLLQVHRHRVWW